MPFRRKYTPRRRRSVRRRSTFRKRRTFRRGKARRPYDSGTNVKVEIIGPLNSRTDWTSGEPGIRTAFAWGELKSWAGYTIADAPSLFESTEWEIYSAIYSEYMISGMKIQITPGNNFGGDDVKHIWNVKWGTFSNPPLDGNEMTANRFKMARDYGSRGYDPSKINKRYYNISSYINRINAARWREIDDQNYAEPATYVNIDTSDFPNGFRLGTYTVTFYVKFRSPKATLAAPSLTDTPTTGAAKILK